MSLKKNLNHLILLGCFISSMFIPSILMASHLKEDEHVMFLPDIAYEVGKDEVAVTVQAWIYEKERRPGMTTLMAKYLGIDKSSLTPEQLAQLYARSQLFRVDSERNKQISIQFADNSIHTLPITAKDGRTSATIRLKKQQVLGADRNISYKVYDSGTPATVDEGTAIFAPKGGFSVISDIDDTIKVSHVRDKKQLLLNTFLNDFEAAQGMSALYNKMANSDWSVAFHYVSSSPIQLYPAIKEFMEKEKFPKGSMQLREGTTWSSVIATGDESKNHKTSSIEKILKAYPEHSFILIGDSGEEDPEIYAEFMRQYPEQILCIGIRDVSDENADSARYQKTFNGLDSKRWKVFKNPSELPNNWCML